LRNARRPQPQPSEDALDGIDEDWLSSKISIQHWRTTLLLIKSSRGVAQAAEAVEYYQNTKYLIDIAEDLRSSAGSISSRNASRFSSILNTSESRVAEFSASTIIRDKTDRHKMLEGWMREVPDHIYQHGPSARMPPLSSGTYSFTTDWFEPS
jgi:hypothetical protein